MNCIGRMVYFKHFEHFEVAITTNCWNFECSMWKIECFSLVNKRLKKKEREDKRINHSAKISARKQRSKVNEFYCPRWWIRNYSLLICLRRQNWKSHWLVPIYLFIFTYLDYFHLLVQLQSRVIFFFFSNENMMHWLQAKFKSGDEQNINKKKTKDIHQWNNHFEITSKVKDSKEISHGDHAYVH